MVTSAILGFLLKIFSPIVEKLPTINLDGLSSSGADTFIHWVSLASYMLPWGTIVSVFAIIIALQIFRIVVAFFKSLWGVLPLV